MLILKSAGKSSGLMRSSINKNACLLFVLVSISFAGCHHNKEKAAVPKAVTGPVRIVPLPLNLATENNDQRWVALAAPIVLASVMSSAASVEVVPLWEGIPIARDALGNSRSVTPEVAAYVASRLTARWATQGEITQGKNGYAVMLDFIPAKATAIPFRYEKEMNLESMPDHFQAALDQFVHYQVLPLPPKEEDRPKKESLPLKELAEALDREYGWFTEAAPGKAGDLVDGLARSDGRLARLLFNPSQYPILGSKTAIDAPAQPAPAARTQADTPKPTAAAPAPARTEASAPGPSPPPARIERAESPPARTSSRVVTSIPELKPPPPDLAFAPPAVVPSPPDGIVEVPPPRTFIQKLESSKASPNETPVLRRGQLGNKLHWTVAQNRKMPPEAIPAEQPNQHPPPSPNPASIATESSRIRIQVYATRRPEDAQGMASKLIALGYSPEIEKVVLVKKGTLYRIRLQGFATRRAAKSAGEKLVAQGVIKEFWAVP